MKILVTGAAGFMGSHLVDYLINKNYSVIGADNLVGGYKRNINSKSTFYKIDLRNKNISGKKAEAVLGKADITVNKNMVPYDDKSAFVTSGIRVGVPAITTRGMKKEHMGEIVTFIDDALMNADHETTLMRIREKVNTFMQQFPLYPELG